MSLKYVKNKDLNIINTAVMNNGNAIKFVKNQTLDLCLKAVLQDPNSLQYIKDKTKDIKKEAVKQCLFIIENNINYIDKITDLELKKVVIKMLNNK